MRITNDQILNAVFAGQISIEALKKIIEIHDLMVSLNTEPKNFARLKDPEMTKSERLSAQVFYNIVNRRPMYDDVNDDGQIKAAHERLAEWKQMNPAIMETVAPNGGRFQNKITLIKKFREDFSFGLADAKNMIELMYERA